MHGPGIFIAKINKDGECLAHHVFSEQFSQYTPKLAKIDNALFLTAEIQLELEDFKPVAFVARINQKLTNVNWRLTGAGAARSTASDITAAGNFIYISGDIIPDASDTSFQLGDSEEIDVTSQTAYAAKLRKNGHVEWIHLTGVATGLSSGQGIRALTTGVVYLIGYFQGELINGQANFRGNIYLEKLASSNGSLLIAAQLLPVPPEPIVHSQAAIGIDDISGRIVVGGTYAGTNPAYGVVDADLNPELIMGLSGNSTVPTAVTSVTINHSTNPVTGMVLGPFTNAVDFCCFDPPLVANTGSPDNIDVFLYPISVVW